MLRKLSFRPIFQPFRAYDVIYSSVLDKPCLFFLRVVSIKLQREDKEYNCSFRKVNVKLKELSYFDKTKAVLFSVDARCFSYLCGSYLDENVL